MDTIENIVYLATLISGGKRITAPLFLWLVGQMMSCALLFCLQEYNLTFCLDGRTILISVWIVYYMALTLFTSQTYW